MDLVKTQTSFTFDGREVRSDSICLECFKIFDTPIMKRRHIAGVHQKEKPWPCGFEGCDRSFSSKVAMQRHRTGHSGDLPFHCPDCDKRFKVCTETVERERERELTDLIHFRARRS